MNQILSRVKC